MTLDQVDTDNYLAIAISDDLNIASPAAFGSTTPQPQDDAKAARAAAREKRIAAAVQRSKVEYQDEHAYTERGWLSQIDPVELKQTSPLDAHKFEQVLVSLYYSHPPQHKTIVHAILDAVDPKAKVLGGLTREVLDMGLRAAIACGDTDNALRLAELSEPIWGHQMAGLAANASDALAMAGHDRDALIPLFVSTSSHGLHVPLLIRMTELLSRIHSTVSVEDLPILEQLEAVIGHIITLRRFSFERPLFPDRSPLQLPPAHGDRSMAHEKETEEAVAVGRLKIILQLDEIRAEALQGTVRRLEKGLRGAEPQSEEPRGVREL